MARKPSIRAKNGYWFSEAGGVGRYFGRADVVRRAEATASFGQFLQGLTEIELGRFDGMTTPMPGTWERTNKLRPDSERPSGRVR
jgi:hypothetical protein